MCSQVLKLCLCMNLVTTSPLVLSWPLRLECWWKWTVLMTKSRRWIMEKYLRSVQVNGMKTEVILHLHAINETNNNICFDFSMNRRSPTTNVSTQGIWFANKRPHLCRQPLLIPIEPKTFLCSIFTWKVQPFIVYKTVTIHIFVLQLLAF